MESFLFIFILIFVIILYAIYCYNHSLSLQQVTLSSKSNLSSYIKKMESIFEKVLNESISGTKFEKDVLKSITKIRKVGTDNPNALMHKINDEIARYENYPTIKSQKLREKYQNEVSSLEREIHEATEVYSDSVVDYNGSVGDFISSLYSNGYLSCEDAFEYWYNHNELTSDTTDNWEDSSNITLRVGSTDQNNIETNLISIIGGGHLSFDDEELNGINVYIESLNFFSKYL